MTPATEPNTRAPTVRAVAFVVTPFRRRQAAAARGRAFLDPHNTPHQLTADAIDVIDFYPANPPTNHKD